MKADDWLEIDPGRVARLRLRGPEGALDIFVGYLHTGKGAQDRAARRASLRAMAGAIQPRHVPCSAHRPVAFSRKIPKGDARIQAIDKSVTSHPDFARRVAIEFHDLQARDEAAPSAFRQLVLMKRAMGVTGRALGAERSISATCNSEDKLGDVLGFFRAAEKVNLHRMEECAKAYPNITTYVHPSNPEARLSSGCMRLRDHAVMLARQQITEEVETMRDTAVTESDAGTAHRRKNSILAKLKRLLPGSPNSFMAVQTENGEVAADPEKMAEALRRH